MIRIAVAGLLSWALGCASAPAVEPLPRASKDEVAALITMMRELPRSGEFYKSAAAPSAKPFVPTLVALTEEDLGDLDLYPFVALIVLVSQDGENTQYVIDRFDRIRESRLKLFWGAFLFNMEQQIGAAPVPENIRRYLRAALDDPEDAQTLREITGPGWDAFQQALR